MPPTSPFNSIEVTLSTIYFSRYMDYAHKNIVLYHINIYIYDFLTQTGSYNIKANLKGRHSKENAL